MTVVLRVLHIYLLDLILKKPWLFDPVAPSRCRGRPAGFMRQMLTGWKKSEARAAREQLLAAREKGSPDPSDPNAKKVL